MTNMREDYEKKFPKPSPVFWDSKSERYRASDSCDTNFCDVAAEYQYGFEVWQAARTGGEVEAIARHLEAKAGKIADAYGHHEPDTNAFVFDRCGFEDEFNVLQELAEEIRERFADCPAPAAAVPDALPMPSFSSIDRGSKNYKAGWNACRSAILTAAPQPVGDGEWDGHGNPPVGVTVRFCRFPDDTRPEWFTGTVIGYHGKWIWMIFQGAPNSWPISTLAFKRLPSQPPEGER